MKPLTEQELRAILTARNYQPITDQEGVEWLLHYGTGNAILIETQDGQEHCAITRAVAHRKETKKQGKFWFVSRDPDLNKSYDAVVEFNGDLHALQPVAIISQERIFAERDARLRAAGIEVE